MAKSRLTEMREKKGLTQQALASLIFVEQSTICKYENKKRKMTEEVIQRIADALDADPNELRGDQGGNTIFENASVVNGNGIGHIQNYYHVPKELLDSVQQQQTLTSMLQLLMEKLK